VVRSSSSSMMPMIRDDLGILFATAHRGTIRRACWLTLRPYGRESVNIRRISFAEWFPRSRDRAESAKQRRCEALASEVLARCNGPVHAAREIANVTSD